jgi:hypothetical protein
VAEGPLRVKLVLSLVVSDDADVLDAHLAYHLNAGVDFVLAAPRRQSSEVDEILGCYEPEGFLRRIPVPDGADDASVRTSMARVAAHELGADWLIDSAADEFWLPRGESLKDVLAPIPPRYGLVQALVRVFLPRPENGRPFYERMTVRRAAGSVDDETMGRLDWALRPVYRTRGDLVLGLDREAALDGRVPLRAWYPIELLRFPLRTQEQAELRATASSGGASSSRLELALHEATKGGARRDRWEELVVSDTYLSRGLDEATLVEDTRLADALRRIAHGGSPRGFRLPPEQAALELHQPTIVEDVAYAVECAAVREVDFEPLVARIAELEQRIGSLEAGFWPRARRALRRIVHR